MKQPFSTVLLATILVLSTFGCSKNDDPATSPAAGTSSYTLDGRTISARATAVVTTSRTSTGQNYDMLDIQLVTTPQPQSGSETLDLIFQKSTGQPAAAYQLTTITLLNGARTQSVAYANDVTTLSTTSGGGFSGTFSAKATSSTISTIQNGVFTDVRP